MNESGNQPTQQDGAVTSYDRVPYKSYPFPQTHPSRLATIAALFGLTPARVDRCRVLELGCASGGNLFAMAEQFPESNFLGIDNSSRQIADGQTFLDRLGLKNLELRHQNILDFPGDAGEFDYILCHGVYSWVPDEVQRKILEICRQSLAPNGVAYISYNTYPGWHMRGMIREIMRYRARFFETPESQLAQARGLLSFLSQSVQTENNAYGILLKQELESISRADNSYLLHEHLEDINEPVYFHQFMDRAQAADLQYLGEADYGMMCLDNFPDHVRGMLQSFSGNLIETEQYMDFLRNRAFRQTLLCRREVRIDRDLAPERLLKLQVASSARPEANAVDLKSPETVVFRRYNSLLRTNDAIVKAAMLRLAEVWPQSIPFTELAAMARSLVENQPAAVDAAVLGPGSRHLAETFLRCFATSMIDLRTHAPQFVTNVSDKPVASPLARAQAATSSQVTNRLHERISLDDFQRQTLCQLNGNHSAEEIVKLLVRNALAGDLIIHRHNQRLTDEADLRPIIEQQLPPTLQALTYRALLVG